MLWTLPFGVLWSFWGAPPSGCEGGLSFFVCPFVFFFFFPALGFDSPKVTPGKVQKWYARSCMLHQERNPKPGPPAVALLPAGSTAQFYAEDFLGTSRVVTTNAGAVCYDADFYPYGGERTYTNSCTQNNYKFEGKERDTETGNDDSTPATTPTASAAGCRRIGRRCPCRCRTKT